MQLDKELIHAAIEELKAKNAQVNIPAIAKVTGYPAPSLYLRPECRPYVRRYPSLPRGKAKASTPIQPQTSVEHTVEAYVHYISESFFAHPETVSQVRDEMMLEVARFNIPLFNQAVNLLKVHGKLQKTAFGEDTLVKSKEADAPKQLPIAAEASPKTAAIYTKQMVFPLTHGELAIHWPSELTVSDKEDLEGVFQLILRKQKQL